MNFKSHGTFSVRTKRNETGHANAFHDGGWESKVKAAFCF